MSTPKKTPPDVAALKSLIQEQALTIAALQKERDSLKAQKESSDNAMRHHSERADKAESVINEAHDLMDACPAALPRTVVRKRSYYADEEVQQNLIVRMGSWLGATKVS